MTTARLLALFLTLVISLAGSSQPAVAAPPDTASSDSGSTADYSTASLSECASGRFCMWSSTSYTGSFSNVSGSGVTRNLTQTVKSVWNNRSQAARLYNNAGTSWTCLDPGERSSSLASAYQSPAKVYLSAGTSC